MGSSSIEHSGENDFLISGELSFASVPLLLDEGERKFLAAADGCITVDLKGVSRTDSAGLALLVEWMRRMRQRGHEITFANVPSQMLALARLSGLERVLLLPVELSPSSHEL